ncbi:hypothetical protein, partial [Klebsiella quasipneumoniae]|uniref:hypothetical protein n=1 Tax=Klebsiella quasipneumoniae TaxID=1463165 RepID=UPI003967D29E
LLRRGVEFVVLKVLQIAKRKRHNLRLRIFLRSCVSRRNLTAVKTKKTALQGGFFEGSLSYQLFEPR